MTATDVSPSGATKATAASGMLTVVKRDGRTLTFDDSRIRQALYKAFEAVHGDITDLHTRAIAALNYRPNLSARNLRKGRTGLIALAVPELDLPYFAELARHVVTAAAAHGWTVLIDQTGGSSEQEREVAAILHVPVRLFLPDAPVELIEEERSGWRLRYGAFPVEGHRVWGATGLFLAMPLIAALKAVCSQVPEWKPWANLMSSHEDDEPPPTAASNESHRNGETQVAPRPAEGVPKPPPEDGFLRPN